MQSLGRFSKTVRMRATHVDITTVLLIDEKVTVAAATARSTGSRQRL